MEFALILQARLHAIALKDLLVHVVKQTLMNVNHILVKMKEAVWMIQVHSDVYACQVFTQIVLFYIGFVYPCFFFQ